MPQRALVSLPLILSLAFAAGCDCSGDPTPTACSSASDCEDGQRCVDGTCVAIPDSGPIDPNADGGLPADCVDLDRDGYPARSSECGTGSDCDDANANVNPAVAEVCSNGADDDCDGQTDEPDCACNFGDRISCYSGPDGTAAVGVCRRGVTICGREGEAGACAGEVLPGEETGAEHCDFVDNDCDGEVDEGLRNACGECAEERVEMCSNEIDDDCDGMVDEDCHCDYRCECVDGTSCECQPPTNQPCYEGPFGTEGKGTCAGGRRDCNLDAASGETRWGVCEGQTLPGIECEGGAADGIDQDCDGIVDEGCRDADGDGSPWPTDCNDEDEAVYPGAPETCDGVDQSCDGVADEGVTNGCGGCGAPPATDECGNGRDDDCDGAIDDGCTCSVDATQGCYGGPEDTLDVGACRAGTQTCAGSTEFPEWGACEGQVIPSPEICNGADDDCDGMIDERGAVGANACGFCDPTEICDGLDQDCDGLIDEHVSNACGECGPEPTETCDGGDDDCDGVIDEGVVNACGTCPPEPCFTENWDTPGDCSVDGRFCDDVEEHPDYPGSVTLGQSTLDFDYIYIAVTGRDQVAQLDTRNGNKNWQVPSYGCAPSRTAVASDGSVWVTNRAIRSGCNAASVEHSNVVHLDPDGNLICRAPVLNVARSAAIDGNGDVWAGSYNGGDLYHISGTMVDHSTSPPTCVVLNCPGGGSTLPCTPSIDTNVSIYGLTADPDGYVWTSSSPTTVRVNVADYSQTSFDNPWRYGIAPDGRNQIWFGGWGGSGPVHALDRTTGARLDSRTGPGGALVSQVTAVTVHPDGSVWGSGYGDNTIVGIDGSTGYQICRRTIASGSGTNPHGVAVDRQGRIWVVSRYGGYVNVYDNPSAPTVSGGGPCHHIATYPVDPPYENYSYSDMTGHLLRTFVSPEGRWQQIFDSGYADAYWTRISWTSIEPPGTDIEVVGRTADTVAGLDAGVACGPFNTSPADLSGCPAGFQNHRYMRVETRLLRSGTDERPILTSIDASWAY